MFNWFNNLRSWGKITILASILLVFLIGISFLGLNNMSNIKQEMEKLYKEDLHSVDLWGQIHAYSLGISTHILNHLGTDDPSVMIRAERSIAEAKEIIENSLAVLEEFSLGEVESQLMADYREAYNAWEKVRDSALMSSKMGDKERAESLIDDAKVSRDNTINLALELQQFNRSKAENAYLLSEGIYNSSLKNFIIIMILAALLAIILTFFISRSIAIPLTVLEKNAWKVAGGNLTVSWELATKRDEAGRLSISLTKMLEQFRELIGAINKNSQEVFRASEELAGNTGGASDTLEQITVSVSELAHGANEQAEASQIAAGQANQINQVMAQNMISIDAMVNATNKTEKLIETGLLTLEQQNESVKENVIASQGASLAVSSLVKEVEEIGGILATISQIADQTNLLALNAAIEAARAGEQGRGFAVVAEEIRKLAEESAVATGEIGQIVNSVQSGATKAVEEMDKAGLAMKIQEDNAGKTTGVFTEISNALNEMVVRVNEMIKGTKEIESSVQSITAAIEGIASVSEENAASAEQISAGTQEQNAAVEEMAASASALEELARQLQLTAEKFILDRENLG